MQLDEKLRRDGWAAVETSAFLEKNGPVLRKDDGGNWRYALLSQNHHANVAGRVHGGMVMVFADYALGMAAYERLGMRPSVTLQLNVNLVASARIGELIESEAVIVRQVNDIVFMRGTLMVGERTIATADGVWRIVASPPES